MLQQRKIFLALPFPALRADGGSRGVGVLIAIHYSPPLRAHSGSAGEHAGLWRVSLSTLHDCQHVCEVHLAATINRRRPSAWTTRVLTPGITADIDLQGEINRGVREDVTSWLFCEICTRRAHFIHGVFRELTCGQRGYPGLRGKRALESCN